MLHFMHIILAKILFRCFESASFMQSFKRIHPQYAMVLKYNIRPEIHETYYRYMLGEFVPALEEMNVYLQDVWHVAYGGLLERQVDFVTEDREFLKRMISLDRWIRLEERLQDFTVDYERRIVRYNGAFRV